jgi:hypothetical protein
MSRGIDGAPREFSGARPLAVMGLGVAVLLTAGVVACQQQPAPDVGATTVTALATSSAPAAGTGPAVPVRDGTLPTTDDDVEAPVRMRIPALGLTATVAPVGVDARTGDFDVPPGVDRVGWYRFGPGVEATAGSVVIAGHVDSAAQGKGAFFKLTSLKPGATITVTGADGTDRVFAMVARKRYAKTRIPLEKYFARDGAPRLTLITCGGPFDARTGHYRDNVVVTAEPV